MKRLLTLLFCSLLATNKAAYGQNIPTGSSVIPGPITNVIPLPGPYTLGGSPLVNYVRIFQPQYSMTNADALTETTGPSAIKMGTVYMDGFGRKMESIIRNNGGYDLITPYDNRPGPNQYAYSPYSTSPSDAFSTIHVDPFTEQNSYYSSVYPDEPGTAITERSYQSGATSRSIATFLPGKSNVGQENGILESINTNGAYEVIIWKIDPSSSTGWPSASGYYEPGTLTKKITISADGGQSFEYFDNENKLISKWISVGTSTSSSPVNATTYYVYDFYDRLAYTLRPKAMEKLSATGWVPDADIINNLCDFVIYDNYGREVELHLAGENGNNMYVYDQYNRVALSHTPNDAMTATPWWFNHYDKLNRVINTGSCTLTDSRNIMQSWFDNNILPSAMDNPWNILYYLYHDNQQGVYPPVAPLTMGVPYTYNFYDNYNYSGYLDYGTSTFHPFTFMYDPSVFSGHLLSSVYAVAPPATASLKTQGKLIYSVSKVIIPSSIPYAIPTYQPFTSAAFYYDDYGRNVETINKNIHSDNDVFGNQYNFTGNILTRIANYTNHDCVANPHTNLVTNYVYDPFTSRLLDVQQSINGGVAAREIVGYEYNNLGQISAKNIGGTVENQLLTYNIRNQLTGINAAFAEGGSPGTYDISFGESIKYDAGFTHNRLGGDIAGIIWRSTGENPQAYGYTYDNAGRLIQADYREYSSASVVRGALPYWNNVYTDYTEGGITYDANGNILTLNRYGPVDHGTYVAPGKIDDLTYTYGSADKSNQIQRVSDVISLAATSTGGLTPYDFKPGSTAATNYYYDNNGNTTYDLNKSVGTTYNYLNKPETRIFTSSTDRNDFAYDASGNKLLSIDNNLGITHITEYGGEVQYKDNKLYLIGNQEGYAMPNATTGSFDFYYYIRDHLGNVRNVLSAVPGVSPVTPEGGGGGGAVAMVYHATHETGSAPIEDLIFDNMDYVRDFKPDAMDSADVKGAHLDAADSTTTIGTTLVLKVMAGDSFAISANSYYSSSDTATGTIDSAHFINAILSTLVNGTGALSNADAGHLSDVTKLFSPDNIGIFNAIGGDAAVDSTIPLAFINYILYDENFNIIPGNSGRIQIGTGPDGWHTMSSPSPVVVTAGGYLSVFMSSATLGVPVYIDPMVVYYWKGSIVDINHYYPYGLCFNKSTSATPYNIEHDYLYQTTKQDRTNGLYLDDFDARQYNPQLGKFEGIDPANQYSSGYIGMGNNPVYLIDPTGMDGESYEAQRNLEDFAQAMSGSQGPTSYVGSVMDGMFYPNPGPMDMGPADDGGIIASQLLGFTVTAQAPPNNGGISPRGPIELYSNNWGPERYRRGPNSDGGAGIHAIDEWLINMMPIVGELNLASHILSGKGLQDQNNNVEDDPMDRTLMMVGGLRGMSNPKTKAAANRGNALHYDQLNGGTGEGLPTQLLAQYPNTQFRFALRRQRGADVEVIGGTHPSEYPGSTWNPANNYGDFKPATPSGIYQFLRDLKKGKLPPGTEKLLYDPTTGKLK